MKMVSHFLNAKLGVSFRLPGKGLEKKSPHSFPFVRFATHSKEVVFFFWRFLALPLRSIEKPTREYRH
jgi:hypothetical protein